MRLTTAVYQDYDGGEGGTSGLNGSKQTCNLTVAKKRNAKRPVRLQSKVGGIYTGNGDRRRMVEMRAGGTMSIMMGFIFGGGGTPV